MATVESEEQAPVMESGPEQLNATAAREVADLLAEAEKRSNTQQPGSDHWFYRVPFAGVRYYSY